VIFARAVSRPDEAIEITTLGEADPHKVDMATLVLIGSSATHLIERGDGRAPWVLSPRSYEAGT